MPWEDVKHIFRPDGVHMGVMQVDPTKCTRPRGSNCQLCWDNCPFRAWDELKPGEPPKLKTDYACFSCYNCQAACPRGALTVVEPYHVDDGFWKTEPHTLEARLPMEPLDADSNPDEWNAIERAIYNRRSVRNFKEDPVPETLIRRVLEAGRFAPSAGNCQPWRFVVVTDRDLIHEMDEVIWGGINLFFNMYTNDELVKQLAENMQAIGDIGTFDPRIMVGGMGSISKRAGPAFLNAPAVILILADDRAIGGPQVNVGICGQNMVLVGNSLGIKTCWVGFASVVNTSQPMMEKLGIQPPWRILSSVVMGYPRFKQEGIVAREYRPVTWFRPDRPAEID